MHNQGLTTQSQQEANYVEAQKIYLDFLESGRQEVSPTQLQFLRSAGAQVGKLNAYSRTVLYLVSGERSQRIAPFANPGLDQRARKANDSRYIHCNPNPVHSSLYLMISESDNLSYKYKLSDMNGIVVKDGSVESNHQELLDVSSLSIGIYILAVYDETGGIIHHDRIVVTK